MIADSMCRRARRWAGALACVTSIGLGGAAPGWAGKLTCLTGTDPSVASDAYQLAYARAFISTLLCPCPSFDGSPGKKNADYVKCVKQYADALRPQCKGMFLKEAKNSTCGLSPSQDVVDCIKKSASGKVSCAIKPSAQCVDKPGKFTQVACTSETGACVDAADTNGDGLIGSGDSGACAAPVCGNGVREGTEQCDPPGATCAGGGVCDSKFCYCLAPTNTPTPTLRPGQPTNTPAPPPPTNTRTPTPVPGQPTNTSTPASRFVDNGDGTITDNQTGLMWEKKDQSGGLDDVNNRYTWAGKCSDGSGLCQPDGFAASLCASQTGGALGCLPCAAPATCDTAPLTTIWQWLAHLRIAGFGGHSDWRIPTVAEEGTAALETIVDTSAPGCGTYLPCVPAIFNTNCTPGCNATGCSCTVPFDYWSGSTVATGPDGAWLVGFDFGNVGSYGKLGGFYVRAVR